ncbi:DUF1801 domain-containing protein [Rhizobium sp.]
MMTETPVKKPARKPLEKPADGSPVLLSGGNPQIPKGYGDEHVEAYLAAMPGWKQDVGRRLDALIAATVPGVAKAVKWNTPFYSADGKHWFVGFHCLTKYVKVSFPDGSEMDPMPPGTSKQPRVRYLDIYENDAIDATQFSEWIRQAARLPGEKW